jgi:hypothetical protein
MVCNSVRILSDKKGVAPEQEDNEEEGISERRELQIEVNLPVRMVDGVAGH